jgi:hypothetical protein
MTKAVFGGLAAVAGAVLAMGTAWSVTGTLLVPRGRVDVVLRSADRLVDLAFRLLLRPVRSYHRRDAMLAVQGPAVLVTQLMIWVVALDVAYALLLLPAAGSMSASVREATSSMFTLGFVAPRGHWSLAVDAAAALTGLTVVALQSPTCQPCTGPSIAVRRR